MIRLDGRVLGRLFLASTLLAISVPLSAQAVERSGRGYFQIGFHQLDLDELNARLAANGIPRFDDGFATLGGGGHAQIGRLMIGGEGQALLEQTETSGGFQRKLSGGLGFFDLGYVFTRLERASGYVLFGLGAGGLGLRTAERSLPSFEEVLDEPRRGSDVAVGGFLLQAALGGDFLVRPVTGARRYGGLSVGVRAGYVFAPWNGEWQLNGSDVPGGPEVGLGGPYARLSIGGGGSRRQ